MTDQHKDYGLRWLKFYVKWRFPISFVFSVISILNEIVQGIDQYYFSLPLYAYAVLFDVAVFIFAVVVYIYMRGLKPIGYTLNMILITVECLSRAMVSALNAVNTRFSIAFFTPLLFEMLLWGLPNYIYFKHRKVLFDGRKTINDIGDSTADDRNRVILYCEKCTYTGSDINNGGIRLCPECGAALVNTQMSREKWINLSDQERSEYKRNWTKRNAEINRTIINESSGSRDSNSSDVISYCYRCGKKVPEGTVYCPYCGLKLS